MKKKPVIRIGLLRRASWEKQEDWLGIVRAVLERQINEGVQFEVHDIWEVAQEEGLHFICEGKKYLGGKVIILRARWVTSSRPECAEIAGLLFPPIELETSSGFLQASAILLGVALSLAFWADPKTKISRYVPEHPRKFIAQQFEGEHGDLNEDAEY
ncbi:MAG: hypothetical protein GXP25_15470 [Planctomycetes bacterium]|nr:hypothetical protein [Planctomycetota bacterium]